jgi:pyrrolidone-carboxylate peptidase
MTVEEWVPVLAAALGLETEVDVDEILAVAGVVAHGVERKAAPVSTFLVGLAAGRAGATPESIAEAIGATRRAVAEL